MQKATLNIQQANNVINANQGPRLVPLNLPQQNQAVVQKHIQLNIGGVQTESQVQPTNKTNVQLQIKPRTAPQVAPQNNRPKAELAVKPQTAPVFIRTAQQGQTQSPVQLNVTSPQIQPSPGGAYRITAADYQRYGSTREHIYNITDTYIGSDEQMPRSERVLNLETMVFQEEEITVPEGVERIFVEISSNAGDNVARSLRHKIDPGEVTIKMDGEIISVRNGGIPIPVEIHPVEKMWAPQLIFGVLHSSSNYNKEKVRTECGRNGYGAKLTNIFSKYFMVTVGDPNNKRWYRQVWTENMTIQGEPEIKEGYTGEAFVEIVYKMDFKRFGYERYPDQAFRLFSRHAADMSFTGKVPVSFNGIKLNVQKAKDYAKLYLGEEAVKNSIIYYQWAPGIKTVEKKGIEYAVDPGVVPMVEICAVDTPDNALNVSFVNGMWTRNGGVHADAAFKAVATGLLSTVNGNDKGKKKNRAHKLNLGDVKRHVSMFVSCWLGDPKFDGQTKTALRSPTPKIVIDEKILQPIAKWDLINRLYAELEAKHFRASVKSDGKKKRFLSDIKGEDANDAGTVRSGNCTLYVTEGKSAMGFAVSMLSLFEKGRDFIGLLPLKGKPLNVMNAPPMQVAENTEILELKKMLGLRERVNYLLDENFETLRYGHLMILADADTDGKHILGLVLNLFHCKYPSLLARGYVKYLRTKIVDVKKGRQYFKFYSNHEYEEWQANTPDWKTWEHNYYKGLGSSSDADIAEEFRAPKIVQCFYDDLAPMALELAFHEKLSDNRKDWIRNWQPDFKVEEMQMQPISAFINHELIQFSIADVGRSIPRFMDGLKKVQRKIIWGSMKKWKKTKKNAVVKVGNLASYVSEKTEYHHGPKSMCDAIVNMVHDFVGSNNLPYFKAEGQFGTRNMLGKDAADPRYSKTRPEWWWNHIFKKEDIPLLTLLVDEGKECEPVTFLPIIPLHIINGTSGIGTGHSTFIPNHDPLDICQWLTAKIKGYPLPPILPWYRGFKGNIKLVEKSNKKKKQQKNDTPEEVVSPSPDEPKKPGPVLNVLGAGPNPGATDDEDEIQDDEDDDMLGGDGVAIDKATRYTMITMGAFNISGNKRKVVTVTELPIGRATHDYDAWLRKQREDKVIASYTTYSNKDKVHFEITGMKNPSLKNLRLTKSYGMSNMVLLDTNDRPIKYNSTHEIMESFYALRLPYYQLRKDNILKEMQEKIDLLNAKIRFIMAVIHGYNLVRSNPQITIEEVVKQGGILSMGLSKKQIIPQMEALGFSDDLLKRVTLYQCTLEELEAARNELQKELDKKGEMEKIRPEDMWQSDIDDFVMAYCKEYKCKPVIKNNVSLNITNPM